LIFFNCITRFAEVCSCGDIFRVVILSGLPISIQASSVFITALNAFPTTFPVLIHSKCVKVTGFWSPADFVSLETTANSFIVDIGTSGTGYAA